jgi:hypothetical protein
MSAAALAFLALRFVGALAMLAAVDLLAADAALAALVGALAFVVFHVVGLREKNRASFSKGHACLTRLNASIQSRLRGN